MDQESALSDLFRAVGWARGSARTVLTHAARSDSKGNGQAEKAVQSIEEILRTLFIDLEQRCGEELSVHDSFFPWLLEHACDLLNRYKYAREIRLHGSTAPENPTKVRCTPSGPPLCTGSPDQCKGGLCPRDGSTASGSDSSSHEESILLLLSMAGWSGLERLILALIP